MQIAPWWRRYIAVAPGARGAAIWFCETPSGSLRVYREADISNVDASEVGRAILERTLPDIREFMLAPHKTERRPIQIYLEKEAFAPIEPIGSFAELMEAGIQGFEPGQNDWQRRMEEEGLRKVVRFDFEIVDFEEMGAWDRLRELLRFAPPDHKPIEFDREYSIDLSRRDIAEYTRYMAAVDGRVTGEWPKIKFSDSCAQTAQALGAARNDKDINPFLRALLMGISAPKTMAKAPCREVPWSGHSKTGNVKQMRRRRIA